MKVNLANYTNSHYDPGSSIKRAVWFFVNMLVFRTGLFPVYNLKSGLLRLFGARMGKYVVIKPYVNIKYPWFLSIGDHSWIGENVWIDNLDQVNIGSNCSVSQGAFLLTGNHDFTKSSFDLITKPITLEDGVWIGAKAIVCPGVVCKSHSVLAVNSVTTSDLDEYSVYQGNPATFVKKREIVDR